MVVGREAFEIRDCLYRWAQKAQVGVIKEKDGLCGNNNNSRHGDIFIYLYLMDHYAFDVAITSPYKLV